MKIFRTVKKAMKIVQRTPLLSFFNNRRTENMPFHLFRD